MVTFTRKQHVYNIGGIEVGGLPGERPMVLIGSIFFGKHKIVLDPEKGIFDKDKANIQLDQERMLSTTNCIPRFIDPIGDTSEAIINYVEFLAEHTEAPILLDSPYQQARLDALRYFSGQPIMNRLVYNSIAEDYTEEEIFCLKEYGVKNAVVLAFSNSALLPADRIRLLQEVLLPVVEKAGVENILVDTGVLDLPSVSWAAEAIYKIKQEFGFPCGCAPANALFVWERRRKQGSVAFQSAAAAIISMTRMMGADFILYGPMRFAPWVYPACAAVDALIAYRSKFSGILPATKDHPLYNIF